ncbi:MAG: FMN reductase (NADH) RutF [Deltaproteobacteria bacterium]|jgi:flavin reductase|nr:FMN reductase (NADH) RutF [Deltaproteobacteria bacterium]
MTSVQETAAQEFLSGMRIAASGVTVVTANGEGATVSAMNSVSSDPPSLLVCLYKGTRTESAIDRKRGFCVNILGESHSAIARVFAGMQQAEERFPKDQWISSPVTGSPLLKDAVASFDCEVDQRIDYATHTIFIGQVRHSQVRDHAPLIYSNCNFHGLGKLPANTT